MGIDYYLINHHNATYYELGKGPWNDLNYEKIALYDADLMAVFLEESWDNFDHANPGRSNYFVLVGKDVARFVGDAPPKSLVVYADCGDEHVWAHGLKYVCNGVRYNLDDPEKNAADVKEYNDCYLDPDRYSLYAFDLLEGDRQIERLIAEGWNTGRLQGILPSLPPLFDPVAKISRFTLALGKGT